MIIIILKVYFKQFIIILVILGLIFMCITVGGILEYVLIFLWDVHFIDVFFGNIFFIYILTVTQGVCVMIIFIYDTFNWVHLIRRFRFDVVQRFFLRLNFVQIVNDLTQIETIFIRIFVLNIFTIFLAGSILRFTIHDFTQIEAFIIRLSFLEITF